MGPASNPSTDPESYPTTVELGAFVPRSAVPPHDLAVQYFLNQGLITTSCTVIDPWVALGAFKKVVFDVWAVNDESHPP